MIEYVFKKINKQYKFIKKYMSFNFYQRQRHLLITQDISNNTRQLVVFGETLIQDNTYCVTNLIYPAVHLNGSFALVGLV